MFDDIFGFRPGSQGVRDAEKVSLHTLRAENAELRKRFDVLKRKAQNNIDRAHNRAIRKAKRMAERGAFTGAVADELLRTVRYADEFGRD